jgi:hypothetical protein
MKSEMSPQMKVLIGVIIGLIIVGIFYFAWHKNQVKIIQPTEPTVETPVPSYPCTNGKCA